MKIDDFKKPYKDVKEVIANYRNNTDIPFITNSATIPIDRLEAFIGHVKTLKGIQGIHGIQDIQSVKIYFCREQVGNHLVHKLDSNGNPVVYKKASDKFSQVSLLIVPHDNSHGRGKDIYETGDKTILCMYPGGENSGLCPPNCGGEDI